MTELAAVDFEAPDAETRFVQSLRETGFGVLKNHPLSRDKVNRIYSEWEGFFNSEEKYNYLFDPVRHDGYFPRTRAETAKGQKVRDIKEYYHYYPWGRVPPELEAAVADYHASTVAFASTLLSWVERHSPEAIRAGFREPLSDMIVDSDQSLLRILHYPPLDQDIEPDAIRAAAHEDINLLTILPAASEPGLQVMRRDGSWLDVPCEFGNLIINIGDMLQEASDGYFPSTTHRVINPEGSDARRARISLPLFLHPRPEVVLSDRYTAGSYLQERLEELQSSDKREKGTNS